MSPLRSPRARTFCAEDQTWTVEADYDAAAFAAIYDAARAHGVPALVLGSACLYRFGDRLVHFYDDGLCTVARMASCAEGVAVLESFLRHVAAPLARPA